MIRKTQKKRKTRKYKGGTRKSPLERGLRRVTLSLPTNTVSGASKTIWKVPGSRDVVINSTQEQTKHLHTPYLTQLREFAFSNKLNALFPQFFPEVSFFKGGEEELNVIDGLKKNETSDKRLKYIWLKEYCPPPVDEIKNTYLKKAIQLLVNLMKQGLCYIDIKPMNLGKRGEAYVVIDTGCEDIYYIPKEYQEDYLKGEILICGMCVYHYLQVKGLPIPYKEILPVFSLILPQLRESQENFIDTPFKDKLQAYLEGETIQIPKDMKEMEEMEYSIRGFIKKMTKTYLENDQIKKIREEQKNNLNNDAVLVTISARLKDYATLKHIGQFFKDKLKLLLP